MTNQQSPNQNPQNQNAQPSDKDRQQQNTKPGDPGKGGQYQQPDQKPGKDDEKDTPVANKNGQNEKKNS